MVIIESGVGHALCILSINILQLDAKHGGLYLVKPTVYAAMVEHIFAVWTIVAKGSYHVCQLGIVGCYCSRIAKGSKVLGGIETVSTIAEAAGSFAAEAATMGLSVVFNKL